MTTTKVIANCEKHQLPLDDNGECQLCRLSDMPPANPGSRGGNWTWMIGLALLAAAMTWAVASFKPTAPPPPARGVPGAAPAAPVVEPPTAPRELDAPSQQAPSDAVSPAPSAEEPTEAMAVEEQQELTGQALAWQRARKEVRIVMYVTPQCEVCNTARAYMNANEIAFTELDITADDEANRRLRELKPERPTPLFELDELIFVGFVPDAFEAIRTQAARQHLSEQPN